MKAARMADVLEIKSVAHSGDLLGDEKVVYWGDQRVDWSAD